MEKMTGSIHKINALTQNTFYDSARNSTFKNFLTSTKTVLDFNPYEKVLAAGLGNVKNKIKPGEVSLSQLQQAGASATKYVDTLIRACRHLSHIIAQMRFTPARKLRAVFS